MFDASIQQNLASRRYEVVHATTYSYSEAVPLCHNEVHLLPRDTARQTCLGHRLEVRPAVSSLDECRDYFGNYAAFFTVQERHAQLEVIARSEVQLLGAAYIDPGLTPSWEQVRDAACGSGLEALGARQFVVDSPHSASSAALAEFAAPSFGPGRPWLEAVLDLTLRINRDFVYDPNATNVTTPLHEVLRLRRGVCQDFAHLQIGCLRSLRLPARYISGYLLTHPAESTDRLVGADASHAWLAAWCPELGWVEFDPTNNLVPSLDHVTVAWGRDYSDVCPIKGVFIGGGDHSMTVSVDVRPIEDPPA
jgi:transglutaminase-like putative cysteine protease